MSIREPGKNASLDLAKERLKRAIERVADQPECAKGWMWMQEEILARQILQNPDKAAELTQQAAEAWERHIP